MRSITGIPLHTYMATIMARQIRDREFVSHGASVPLALAALLLAKNHHAPNLDFWLQGTINPTVCDFETLLQEPEAVYSSGIAHLSQTEIINFELRGNGDFQFIRPAQIDRHGDVNVSLLGSAAKPQRRFHGIAVGDAMGVVRRICLYVTEHSPRVFVERVAFATGIGHGSPRTARHTIDLPGGGPQVVVTPLGVLDFEGAEHTLRLTSIHPGISVEQVKDATGFDLPVASDLNETSPPTEVELEVLSRVDPKELRRLEFSEEREAVLAELR